MNGFDKGNSSVTPGFGTRTAPGMWSEEFTDLPGGTGKDGHDRGRSHVYGFFSGRGHCALGQLDYFRRDLWVNRGDRYVMVGSEG